MYRDKHLSLPGKTPVFCSSVGVAFATLFVLLALSAMPAWAQSNGGSATAQQGQSQQQQDQTPAEAGGPGGESGPIVVPKKNTDNAPPPPPKPKAPPEAPEYSLHVNVPVVTIDAHVMGKDGRAVPLSLEQVQEHFRIWEDGVPQKIQSVTISKAPITAVLLVEFAATNYNFMYDALNASYVFASSLQPQDWVAVASFDIKPHIIVDFTQDKQAIFGALNTLRIPGFQETDIYDAMYDMLDRLDRVPGHKELVVVATGRDTFSKRNLDQTLKKIKATPDVTIYTVCTGAAFLERAAAAAPIGPATSSWEMDYLVAQNQMKAFATMTGGRTYVPRFMGELPEDFREIAGAIRDQYTITYKPTNTKQDGTYRKLKVELVGPDDKPLVIKDQKNKDIKYTIIARDGYTAKHEVE